MASSVLRGPGCSVNCTAHYSPVCSGQTSIRSDGYLCYISYYILFIIVPGIDHTTSFNLVSHRCATEDYCNSGVGARLSRLTQPCSTPRSWCDTGSLESATWEYVPQKSANITNQGFCFVVFSENQLINSSHILYERCVTHWFSYLYIIASMMQSKTSIAT